MARFWLRLNKWFSRSVFGVAGAVVFRDFVGRPAAVEGDSMQPLLNPDTKDWCDIVFLSRGVTFDFYKIQRGDVIALFSPSDPSETLIKRVIALEGDSIRRLKGDELIHIPEGHIWVEGDNRGPSRDSNTFGPVSMALTIAKATHIIWPPKRMSAIESAVPPDRNIVPRHLCQQCFEEEAEGSVGHEVTNIFV